MVLLSIAKAYKPTNFTAVKQSGGSPGLTPGTYYYRVAAVNAKGECCACGEAHDTSDVTNNAIKLDWDEVPGVLAANGYKIYRALSDSWDAGSLLLTSVSTNTHTDQGGDTPGAGIPVKFEADVIPGTDTSFLTEAPALNERSNITIAEIPGREGPLLQYHGRTADRLILVGMLEGATVKTDWEILRTLRSHGNPLRIIITAYTITFIDDWFMIEGLPITFPMAYENVAAAAHLAYSLELLRDNPL